MFTEREIFTAEHEEFRATVREFFAREVAPHHERWERDGIVDRSVYAAAAEKGILGFMMPEKFGGLGIGDFRYNAVVTEEAFGSGLNGPSLTLQNDVIAQYLLRFANDEQKERWFPGFASGMLTFAIAMTEPAAGSDLAGIRTTARKNDGGWLINGQKTFISNGINSDAVIVVARTDPDAGHRGISLLVVERAAPGFDRGRNLGKMGLHAQDTAELFFTDVQVPAENMLGEEGRGFYHLMENLPAERLSIAAASAAIARRVFADTLDYCKTRTAFGRPIGSFQANRFALAEMVTELDIAQVYVDDCLRRFIDGKLTAAEAARAKWWVTELTKRVVDRCVQLHGGYGYMTESRVAKAYLDIRIETIFGGTTEIMKEIIGKSLGV
jgi:alkylation response protein AidB-like acyl-CoA dehydrogenase